MSHTCFYFHVIVWRSLVCLPVCPVSLLLKNQCEVLDSQQASDLALAVSSAGNRCYSSWFSASDNSLDNIYSEASLSRIQVALNLEIARYRGEAEQARKLEKPW